MTPQDWLDLITFVWLVIGWNMFLNHIGKLFKNNNDAT